MVEVFKTNVRDVEQSELLIQRLHSCFPGISANFDLEDCDKILRVEGDTLATDKIIAELITKGYQCEVLP